jgi:hypothetical protein
VTAPAPTAASAARAVLGGTALGTGLVALVRRQSLFRRAAMAMAAGLGTILAAMLAAPLHELAGRTGLLVLTALALPAALWLLLRRP